MKLDLELNAYDKIAICRVKNAGVTYLKADKLLPNTSKINKSLTTGILDGTFEER